MKVMAVICNVALFGFTCLVTLTDGPATETSYIVFSLLLFLIPILNVVVISRCSSNRGRLGPPSKEELPEEQGKSAEPSSISAAMQIAAVICNIVLLGFACWAIIDQYPHPREAGLLEFELLVILTPIVSSVAILRKGGSDGWLGLHVRRKV